MSKSALSDAYAAGFKDGRESAGKVRDDDAADHCALGFDGWWQHAVDTTDRSPTIIGIDHAAPDSEITVTYIVDADGQVVG